MGKVLKGPSLFIYPTPALLIGANVDGKPNFLTAGAVGIANGEPPMISVAIRSRRYTHRGIIQNQNFSVNVPSVDLVKETDYCGIVSGTRVDKVEKCKFKVFYGKLGTAPLIEQCPINLECKVVHVLKLDSHSLIIGRVEETYISDECLTNGEPDIDKIRPMIYTVEPDCRYVACGKTIGTAFSIGRELS